MSSINSSAYYSVSGSAASTNGISGLISGMDTAAMVEGMLSGTQAKIDAQKGMKTQSLAKQEIYRDLITSINSFQNKYFDMSYGSTLSTNLGSNSFFNNMMSSLSGGSAIKVNATSSSALSGDMKIAIAQLANNASLKSGKQLSGDNTIVGDTVGKEGQILLSNEELTKQFNKTVSLKVDGTVIDVNLNDATSTSEMVNQFNTALKDKGVTVKDFEGSLRFITTDPAVKVEFSTNSTALGLEVAGLDKVHYSTATDANGVVTGTILQGSSAHDINAGPTIDLSLDGVTKTINLGDVKGSMDGSGKYVVTADDVLAVMDKEVKSAFGDYVTVGLETIDGKKAFKFGIDITNADGTMESGHELRITGADANIFGITPGASSRFSTSQTLAELGAGDRFSFTINDVDFSFDGDTSVGVMINEINNSKAGVSIRYSTMSDTMTMEASSSGSKYGIEIKQTEGDVLTKLFGDKIKAAASVGSQQMTTGTVSGTSGGLVDGFTMTSVNMEMMVNGVKHTFKLDEKQNDDGEVIEYSKTKIETELNSWLKEEFGTTGAGDAAVANISYADGKLTVAEGFAVEFTGTTVDVEDGEAVAEAQKTDLALALGFNLKDNSNIATANTNISDIYGIKDSAASFQKADGSTATTLGDITQIDVNGTAYATVFSDSRLTLTGSGTLDLSGDSALATIFGGDNVTFGDGTTATGAVSAGLDAKILINGIETSRSSNTFTIDGITMTATSVSDSSEVAGETVYEDTVISTARNDDSIVEGMKAFIDDYNKLIGTLNGLVAEDDEYRDYPPLTDAQKKEMTDTEIENWEKKSEVGLLRNDSDINTLLSEMRNTLYSTPTGGTLALYQIGIETTENYEDKGKLEFDEATFRAALASDPAGIRTLFTDSTDGLAVQMTAAMERAANESSGSPGSLVQLAGVKNKSSEGNNELSNDITGFEERIEELQRKYETESARYWRDFNSMESILANYSSQSAYLTQQFGGY